MGILPYLQHLFQEPRLHSAHASLLKSTVVLCAVFHSGDRDIPAGDHRQRVSVCLPS